MQTPMFGGLIGYCTTEFGARNEGVHRRRRELAANPRWLACLAKLRPMIMTNTMTNKIMDPTSFSPTQ